MTQLLRNQSLARPHRSRRAGMPLDAPGRIMRALLCLVVLLLGALPWPALAQDAELPPLPRPRPERAVPAMPETGETVSVTAVPGTPQPVTLTAKVTESGNFITEGLVWRVFDTRADANGQLALLAKSEDAAASFSLPAGRYVVHVAYGRAQASETVTVEPGPNTKTLILDAGALRLSALVTGDVTIPINLVRFDIFTGGTNNERTPVVQGVAPNQMILLNAGVYHVVSYFGAVNAVVRADLRVEPGQMTEATLYHRAAQVAFKLVSEAGGEAIADVEWTIKSMDGQTVFTNIGAFPSTVLAEGEYTLLAKRGQDVFNRQFQVQPGQPSEIEVLAAS